MMMKKSGHQDYNLTLIYMIKSSFQPKITPIFATLVKRYKRQVLSTNLGCLESD